MNLHSLFLLFGLFLIPLSSIAGVATGNTEFLTKTKIKFLESQPHEDEILMKLKDRPLPYILKDAIFSDFRNVLTLESSEKLYYKDFLSKVEMQVKGLETVKIKTSSKPTESKTTYIERRTYESVEVPHELGLYPHLVTVGPDMMNAPLIALTDYYSNRLIIFKKFFNKRTKRQQIETILHEQCHRLSKVLGVQAHDERFARAWASSLYDYLFKNDDGFLSVLGKLGMETTERYIPCDTSDPNCMFKETYLGEGWFETKMTFVFSKEDVVNFGFDGEHIVFDFSEDFVRKVPIWNSTSLRLSISDKDHSYFQEKLLSGRPISIPVKIKYSKEVDFNSDSFKYTSIKLSYDKSKFLGLLDSMTENFGKIINRETPHYANALQVISNYGFSRRVTKEHTHYLSATQNKVEMMIQTLLNDSRFIRSRSFIPVVSLDVHLNQEEFKIQDEIYDPKNSYLIMLNGYQVGITNPKWYYRKLTISLPNNIDLISEEAIEEYLDTQILSTYEDLAELEFSFFTNELSLNFPGARFATINVGAENSYYLMRFAEFAHKFHKNTGKKIVFDLSVDSEMNDTDWDKVSHHWKKSYDEIHLVIKLSDRPLSVQAKRFPSIINEVLNLEHFESKSDTRGNCFKISNHDNKSHKSARGCDSVDYDIKTLF